MILKGNQRGGGQQLAAHLMNSFDNERVEIAEVRGAVATTCPALSPNGPPRRAAQNARNSFTAFPSIPTSRRDVLPANNTLELLERTERSLKLVGQPRAVVFHEKRDKDGVLREHCHAVWSRIDTDKMKAVQIVA
jgi:hypothetical protein